MSKVKSSKSTKFVSPGGSGKMHKYLGAGPQQPGVSSVSKSGGGGKFAVGGSGHMSGKNTVKAAKPC